MRWIQSVSLPLALFAFSVCNTWSEENVLVKYVESALKHIENGEIDAGLRAFRVGYNATITPWTQPDHPLIDRCIEKARTDSSDSKSAAYYAVAILLVHRANNNDLPPVLFEEGIKKNDKLAELYNHMAAIYTNSELYNKALSLASKAIELKPDYLDAIKNRSYIYYKLKEFQKSLDDAVLYQNTIQPKASPAQHSQ